MELLWVFMDVLHCSYFVLDVLTKNKKFVFLIQKGVWLFICFLLSDG